jgi:sRNA-binding protein
LAVGIHHELIAALPDVKPWRIRQLLGWWQWSGKGAYWRVLLRGGPRYRLDGTPHGQVTVQEQAHARQRLAAFSNTRQEGRSPTAASPADTAEHLVTLPVEEEDV